MKLGISTWSFQRYNPSPSIYELLDKIKEIGAEYVDFVPMLKKEQCDMTLEIAKDIREYIDKIGLKAACICMNSEFLGKRGVEGMKEVIINEQLPIAKVLGCPVMRFDVTYFGFPKEETDKSYDHVIALTADAVREIAEEAEKLGIKVCTENHGTVSQAADRILKLIHTVGHKNFGALIDMGNFTGIDADYAKSVSTLAPYAFHAHAKDVVLRSGMSENPGRGYGKTAGGNYYRPTIIGHGSVPIKQCMKILKNAGFEGCLAVEFEGIEDPYLATEISFENISRFLKEIEE